MKKSGSVHPLLRIVLEKIYTVAEIVVIVAIIAFHVACVVPGLLRVHGRSHTRTAHGA